MLVTFASLDAFFIAYSQSDFFGKIIMLGLIALSVICWIVLLYKIWMIRKVAELSTRFQKAFEESKDPLLTLDLASLPQPAHRQIPHPFAQIFQALKEKTVEVLNKNHYFLSQGGSSKTPTYLTPSDLELLSSHVMTTISFQYKALEKHVYILSTIVTLAPFLGLLGTVWGILVTFSGLQEGGAVSSNTAILGGISTALATTVLGLIIAIPALISYNYLRTALKTYTSDMDDFSSTVLSTIELHYRRVD